MLRKFNSLLLLTAAPSACAALLAATGPAYAQGQAQSAAAGNSAAQSSAASSGETIIVEGKRAESTATRFDLKLIDTPQSIKLVTEDVLDFATIRNFIDLTKIDASTNSNGVNQGQEQLSFRGFNASATEGIKIDGLQALSDFPLDLGSFDHIEIIKGPSSTLYGQNSVGGTINALTRRATDEKIARFDAEGGRFDFYRVEADLGGPVTADKSISVRGYGAYQTGGEFLDFARRKVRLGYGTATFKPANNLEIRTYLNYQKLDFTPDQGITVFDPGNATTTPFGIPDVPVSRFFGPTFTQSTAQYLSTATTLDYTFANGWKFRSDFQYTRTNRRGINANASSYLDDTGTAASTSVYYAEEHNTLYGGDASLTGDFSLFGRDDNRFFVGVDSRNVKTPVTSIFGGFFDQNTGDPIPFNIFTPDYDAFGQPLRTIADFAPIVDFQGGGAYLVDNRQFFFGTTAQILLHPIDRLTILAGSRFEHYVQDFVVSGAQIVGNEAVTTGDPPFQVNNLVVDQFSPQVGLTYGIAKEINLYFNYGKSFVPQTGLTRSGRGLNPEFGVQYEGGVKGNFFNRKVTLSLAAYDIKRSGIAGVDPQDQNFLIEIGTQESKGVELEAFGNITDSWSIYSSATYIDAKFKRGANPENDGARTQNVPRYALSVFSDYKFKTGALNGLRVGGGVIGKFDRVFGLPSFIGTQVPADDYVTVDLHAAYQVGRYEFELKGTNVGNKRYYNAPNPGLIGGIFPGRPAEFVARLSAHF